jgi:hypothetical protein
MRVIRLMRVRVSRSMSREGEEAKRQRGKEEKRQRGRERREEYATLRVPRPVLLSGCDGALVAKNRKHKSLQQQYHIHARVRHDPT